MLIREGEGWKTREGSKKLRKVQKEGLGFQVLFENYIYF